MLAKGAVSLELPGNQAGSPGDQTTQLRGDVDFLNNQFNPATVIWTSIEPHTSERAGC